MLPEPETIRTLLASSDVRPFITEAGEPYEAPQCGGIGEIPVLPFLIGLPMNNLALAYIKMLRPDTIRISNGCFTTQGSLGVRINVTVEPYNGRAVRRSDIHPLEGGIIRNITMEAPCGYACGADVASVLRAQREAYGLDEQNSEEE